jgi:hypothetical protein
MSTWLERLTKPSPTNDPPTRGELRRNDLLVAGIVLFALFLAFGIRNQVLNASESVRLGENLPRIAYPARWRTQSQSDALLHVVNAGSPSTFDSQMVVTARPLRPDETLEDARADRGIKLATTLAGYRELAAERMTVQGDQPALVATYAYIADPTRDIGAIGLPVVVEVQDIMFLQDGQFVVVTLEADANRWEEDEEGFAIVTNSLRLQPADETGSGASLVAPAAPTPAGAQNDASGTEAGAGDESGFGETQAPAGNDGQSEGGN